MLVSSLRRVGFAAAFILVALAGTGLSSPAQPAGRPAAIAAASPGRDGPVLQHVPFPTPPPIVLAAPRRLLIPSLGIDAQVEALGIDATGAMDTPSNIWNVGWFRPGPSPGAAGDAVIDGHVGLPGSPLIFSNLAHIASGADLVVVHADGTRSHFAVSGVSSWPANSQPTGLFSTAGPPRLTLITCTGSYDRLERTYAERLIVDAAYTGSG